MSISNNLYPPIINTYMPSFIYNDKCRVYFSLSNFNKYEDVRNNVQVVVNDKNTNQSVLNTTLYPAGIKITTLQVDNSVSGNMKYYIEITPNDIKGGVFQKNRYYKVQIRFTSSVVAPFDSEQDKISQWLSMNSSMFSEWSSVCLIRGIERPVLTIRGFDESVQNKEVIFTTESIDFVGNFKFDNPDGESIEYLENATVKLYKKNDIEENGETNAVSIKQNLTASKSEFSYTFKEAIEEGVSYVIKFSYITNGGYQESKLYTFKIIQYGIDKINANIFATPDNVEGRIKIEVKTLDTIKEDFIGKITIRRASSETGFTQWEDIHHVLLTEAKPIDYTWYDYTVKSGVWYQYCVQRRNRRNDRGVIVKIEEPVMVYFDDVFLTQGGRQLKLKFDTNIGSFKQTVMEAKIDTLGSQFPFIYRNGHTKYRTFPISGLITSFCDEAGLFITKEDIYGNAMPLYVKYNEENDINEYKDFSYEREFRERVMEFLYENNVKLFKSPTEGNILIKLMDINLTPNQQLGRMLYSFTATAYEIDEATIENYNQYDIQKLNELGEGLIQQTEDRLGKVVIKTNYSPWSGYFSIQEPCTGYSEYIYCPDGNIISLINELNKHNGSIGFDNEVKKLKYAKFTFIEKPQLIRERNGELSVIPEKYPGDKITDYEKDKHSIEENDNVINGYWVKINDKDILINAKPQLSKTRKLGDYEVSEHGFIPFTKEEYATYEIDNLDIYSIYLQHDVEVEISYIAENIQTESITNLVNQVYYNKKVGQLEDIFKPGHSVIRDIMLRYNESYDTGYTELIAVNGLSVSAPQGTLLTIKDSLDQRYNQHEISDTCFLDFENNTSSIDEFYISGMRLVKAPYQENYTDLIKDRTDYLYKYPWVGDDKYNRIKDIEYVNQYYKHSIVNEKIVIERQYIHEFPQSPVKNGVYLQSILISEDKDGNKTYEYKYWIYYQNNWYIFDPVEETVQCPIPALINYYCEVVEGEYDT